MVSGCLKMLPAREEAAPGSSQWDGAMPGRVPMQHPAPLAEGKHPHTPSPSPSWGWRPTTPHCPSLSRETGSPGLKWPEACSPPGHEPITLPVSKPLLLLNGKVEIKNLRQISDIL